MVGVLIFCLVFGSVSGVFAASASDIAEHWAEDRLHDWIDRGLLSGYEDGTIRPNKPVRAPSLYRW